MLSLRFLIGQQTPDFARLMIALKSISEGKIAGSPLKLDLVNIKTMVLDKEITRSEDIGCGTRASKRLLSIAKLVLKLRIAVKNVEWDQVGKLLNENIFD